MKLGKIYFIWTMLSAMALVSVAVSTIAVTLDLNFVSIRIPDGGLFVFILGVVLVAPLMYTAIRNKYFEFAINAANKVYRGTIFFLGILLAFGCLYVEFHRNLGGTLYQINGKWALIDHSRVIATLTEEQVKQYHLSEYQMSSGIACLLTLFLAFEYYLRWRAREPGQGQKRGQS